MTAYFPHVSLGMSLVYCTPDKPTYMYLARFLMLFGVFFQYMGDILEILKIYHLERIIFEKKPSWCRHFT